MTAKEYLKQVRGIEVRLRALEKDIRVIRVKINSLQGTDYSKDRVQSSAPADSVADRICKLADYLQDRDKVWDELIEKKRDVTSVIDQVKDNTLSALLMEYYVNGRTWDEVAECLNYARGHVIQKLHPRALREVDAILKENTK